MISTLKGKKQIEEMERDGGPTLLDRLLGAGFSEEVRFEWGPEWNEEASYLVNI